MEPVPICRTRPLAAYEHQALFMILDRCYVAQGLVAKKVTTDLLDASTALFIYFTSEAEIPELGALAPLINMPFNLSSADCSVLSITT